MFCPILVAYVEYWFARTFEIYDYNHKQSNKTVENKISIQSSRWLPGRREVWGGADRCPSPPVLPHLSPQLSPQYRVRVGIVYVPLSELGLSHTLSGKRVSPTPWTKHTRLRMRGWGSPNSDDWRKSLALCLLCGVGQPNNNILLSFKGQEYQMF